MISIISRLELILLLIMVIFVCLLEGLKVVCGMDVMSRSVYIGQVNPRFLPKRVIAINSLVGG